MIRRCFFNKLSDFISSTYKNIKYNKNIASSSCRVKNYQNHKQVPVKKCLSKYIRRDILTAGATICTSIWYESKRDDVEENVAHLIALAKIALERGDVERAKDILQLGIQLSEEHKLYTGVPYLYDILAAISVGQGNLTHAQELLVTAIEKLTIWGYPEDHYNVIDFKLRLARIYSASGNHSMAELGFQTCLNAQQSKILAGDTSEKTGTLYVNVLFWYGVHMVRNNKIKEARNTINTAFEYSTKIKGLSPKQEMVILYTLADLNTELGAFDDALKSMLNAIVLGKGIGSVDLPVCYYKLGTIYEKLRYYDQAKSAYQEALKTAKVFGFFDIVTDAEYALEVLDNDDYIKK